jgi:hypothetical protein
MPPGSFSRARRHVHVDRVLETFERCSRASSTRVCRSKMPKKLAAGLPPDRLRFLRFAGAGHGLAAEQPEAVLSLIREFVLEESEEAAAAQPLSACLSSRGLPRP